MQMSQVKLPGREAPHTQVQGALDGHPLPRSRKVSFL